MLSVAEVLLKVIIRFFKLLDLSEPPCQFSFGVGIDSLLLLHFLFGPSSFGGDLHKVRRISLRHYVSYKHKKLEKDGHGVLAKFK